MKIEMNDTVKTDDVLIMADAIVRTAITVKSRFKDTHTCQYCLCQAIVPKSVKVKLNHDEDCPFLVAVEFRKRFKIRRY